MLLTFKKMLELRQQNMFVADEEISYTQQELQFLAEEDDLPELEMLTLEELGLDSQFQGGIQ